MLITDDWCFACGKANPLGLKLDIWQEDNRVFTIFHFSRGYQGWNNIAHGGIISTLIDELSTWAAVRLGKNVVTAQLCVKFKKPIPIDSLVRVWAEIARDKGRLIYVNATVEDVNDNTIYATGDVTLAPVR